MSREVFEELKQDEAFVEKVANRIYTESDDFEDSMPEPEWICEMTDIANKYIQRFKLAFKLANKVSKQPTLNEDQQIVLKEIKDISQECDYNLLGIIWVLGQRGKHDTNISLFTNNEILQVLQAFATWVEQEAE